MYHYQASPPTLAVPHCQTVSIADWTQLLPCNCHWHVGSSNLLWTVVGMHKRAAPEWHLHVLGRSEIYQLERQDSVWAMKEEITGITASYINLARFPPHASFLDSSPWYLEYFMDAAGVNHCLELGFDICHCLIWLHRIVQVLINSSKQLYKFSKTIL